MLPILLQANRGLQNPYSFSFPSDDNSHVDDGACSCGSKPYRSSLEKTIARCFSDTLHLSKSCLQDSCIFTNAQIAIWSLQEKTLCLEEKKEEINFLLASIWSTFPRDVRSFGFETIEDTPNFFLVQLLVCLKNAFNLGDLEKFSVLLQRLLFKTSLNVCEELETFLLEIEGFLTSDFFLVFQKEKAKVLFIRFQNFEKACAILEDLFEKCPEHAEDVIEEFFLFSEEITNEYFSIFLSLTLSEPLRELAIASYLLNAESINWQILRSQIPLFHTQALREVVLHRICFKAIDENHFDLFELFLYEVENRDYLLVAAAIFFVKIGDFVREKVYSERIENLKEKERFFEAAAIEALEWNFFEALKYIEKLPQELKVELYFYAKSQALRLKIHQSVLEKIA